MWKDLQVFQRNLNNFQDCLRFQEREKQDEVKKYEALKASSEQHLQEERKKSEELRAQLQDSHHQHQAAVDLTLDYRGYSSMLLSKVETHEKEVAALKNKEREMAEHSVIVEKQKEEIAFLRATFSTQVRVKAEEAKDEDDPSAGKDIWQLMEDCSPPSSEDEEPEESHGDAGDEEKADDEEKPDWS